MADSTARSVVWQVTDAILEELGIPKSDWGYEHRLDEISYAFRARGGGVLTRCVGALGQMRR